MEKNKKLERPRLRKEDIGTPVNFRHVQHVGFGDKPQSASPQLENAEPFFRRSDSSAMIRQDFGKENRFSGGDSNRTSQPYSSMSNLSNTDYNDPSSHLINKGTGSKHKIAKTFSGSLLNLNFFPFNTKSGIGDKTLTRGSVRDQSKPNKRLSLGVGFSTAGTSSTPFFYPKAANANSPPNSPSGGEGAFKPFIRRKSSSFSGESDIPSLASKLPPQPPLDYPRYNPNNGNKKAKILQQQHSLPLTPSPPLSPSYDELPPPPLEDSFPLPPPTGLSPLYDELITSPPPPPPPLDTTTTTTMEIASTKAGRGLPPPPSPPKYKKPLSVVHHPPPPPETPPLSPTIFPSTSSSSSIPPPLPKSLPPKRGDPGLQSFFKGKLVRVNAPTLPPLSVPLVRPKHCAPGTPTSWPLEPEIPEIHYDEIIGIFPTPDPDGGICTERSRSVSPVVHVGGQELTIERIQKACHTASSNTTINISHIEPLSKLFSCRLTFSEWPIMMRILFSNSNNSGLNDAEFSRLYSDVIKSSLELWLRNEGGVAKLEDVVSAFEQTQDELSAKRQELDHIGETRL